MRRPRVCSRNSLCLRCLRIVAAVLCNEFGLKNRQKPPPNAAFCVANCLVWGSKTCRFAS